MVHIIIATHKEPRLLGSTISSIAGQTSPDWELIVVDNSPNHYFRTWIGDHKDILGEENLHKLIINEVEPEGGVPGKYKLMGVNFIRNCEDDFVFFMDHDDLIMPTLVENIENIKRNYPECEMISSHYCSVFIGSNDGMKSFWVSGVNQATFGGVPVGNMTKIHTGNFHYEWPMGGPTVYGNKHDYLPLLHPKIIRKQAIDEHRFILNTTTNIDDMNVFDICSIALPEVYIEDVQYVFMCYADFHKDGTWESFNTSCWNTPAGTNNRTDEQLAKKAICNLFDKYGFKKNRVTYQPRKLIFE